jgi:hypothetical protein
LLTGLLKKLGFGSKSSLPNRLGRVEKANTNNYHGSNDRAKLDAIEDIITQNKNLSMSSSRADESSVSSGERGEDMDDAEFRIPSLKEIGNKISEKAKAYIHKKTAPNEEKTMSPPPQGQENQQGHTMNQTPSRSDTSEAEFRLPTLTEIKDKVLGTGTPEKVFEWNEPMAEMIFRMIHNENDISAGQDAKDFNKFTKLISNNHYISEKLGIYAKKEDVVDDDCIYKLFYLLSNHPSFYRSGKPHTRWTGKHQWSELTKPDNYDYYEIYMAQQAICKHKFKELTTEAVHEKPKSITERFLSALGLKAKETLSWGDEEMEAIRDKVVNGSTKVLDDKLAIRVQALVYLLCDNSEIKRAVSTMNDYLNHNKYGRQKIPPPSKPGARILFSMWRLHPTLDGKNVKSRYQEVAGDHLYTGMTQENLDSLSVTDYKRAYAIFLWLKKRSEQHNILKRREYAAAKKDLDFAQASPSAIESIEDESLREFISQTHQQVSDLLTVDEKTSIAHSISKFSTSLNMENFKMIIKETVEETEGDVKAVAAIRLLLANFSDMFLKRETFR